MATPTNSTPTYNEGDKVRFKSFNPALLAKYNIDPNSYQGNLLKRFAGRVRTLKYYTPEYSFDGVDTAVGVFHRPYSHVPVEFFEPVGASKHAPVKSAELPTKPTTPKKTLKAHTILGQQTAKKHLEVAIERNLPVLLVGDTGTGKTTIVKDLADKHRKRVLRFSITGETTVDEFVGKYVLENGATVWQDGILLYAMKAGHWLVVDEVNVALPEILFVLHSLLDDDRAVTVTQHEGELVKPDDRFRFFGTMNPVDEYAGTKDLNKAFKSRFGMILNIDYPAPKVERQVVEVKGRTTPEVASLLVDIGLQIRKAKKADEVFFTCSTRDLIQTAQLVEPLGVLDALKIGLVNKANGDTEKVEAIIKRTVADYESAIEQNIELNINQAIALHDAKQRLIEQKKVLEATIRAKVEKELKAKQRDTKTKTRLKGSLKLGE